MKNSEKTYQLYSKSKLPDSDYVINPYTGCLHGCLYCYACFMKRFTGHTKPWGTYCEPKSFAAMKLPRQQEGKTILIGSVTDAYNPAEKKYCQMPEILKTLKDCQAHVEILTKSKLILRDMELIRQVPDISVGVSLALTSEQDAAVLEPGASSVRERIETLRILHENGIKTYLFAAPYFPGITDLQFLLSETKNYVDYVCVENLNLRGSYKADVLSFISQHHPKLNSLYADIYVKGRKESYWKDVEQEMERLRQESGIPIVSYLYHEKIRKGG